MSHAWESMAAFEELNCRTTGLLPGDAENPAQFLLVAPDELHLICAELYI